MTLRTSLIIDGDSKAAVAAAEGAANSIRGLTAAEVAAQAATERANAAFQAQTAAARLNSAAMAANNAVIRQAAAQRTNLMFQLNDIGVSLAGGMNPLMVLAQQGSQITGIYGSAGKALSEIGKVAASAISRLAPLGIVVGGLAAGFAAMTTEINRNQSQQVSFFDVLAATAQLGTESVLERLKPLTDWFADLWDTISPYIAKGMNFLIGSFDLAFRNVVSIWNGLPAALGDFTIKTANTALRGIEQMLNGARELLNIYITEANKLLDKVGIKLGTLDGKIQLGEIANPFAGRDQGLTDELNKNARDVQGTDYIGLIGDRARKNAAEAAAEAAKKAAGGGKAAQSDYAREIAQIAQRTAALTTEANVIGLSTFAAEKMRKTLELESAARKDATGLSRDRIAEIEREATAYAKAAAALEQQQSAFQALQTAGSNAIDQLGESLLSGGQSLKDAVNSMIKDLLRLALQMAILNPLKNALFGTNDATFGGLGGLFGGGAKAGASSVINMIPGLPSIGKNARGTRNWRGGWTDVGEEGPERVWLPKGSQVLSNSESKAAAGERDLRVTINNHSNAQVETRKDGRGGLEVIISEIDRRLGNGSMGKGFANRFGLARPTGRA